MAAAQQVQKQQLDAVSKEEVVAEVRELLQGLKVEQAWVEAVLKQAEQRLESLAASGAVGRGKDRGGIQCNKRECHVEFDLLSLIGNQPWKFSGDAVGCFTPGDASFVPKYDLYLCASSLDELFSLTSFFSIGIRPTPNNSVCMAFIASEPGVAGSEPRLLAMLKTRTRELCAGTGMGPGKWDSPLIKA